MTKNPKPVKKVSEMKCSTNYFWPSFDALEIWVSLGMSGPAPALLFLGSSLWGFRNVSSCRDKKEELEKREEKKLYFKDSNN